MFSEFGYALAMTSAGHVDKMNEAKIHDHEVAFMRVPKAGVEW